MSIIDPHSGEKKFYKGYGRTKDRNINDFDKQTQKLIKIYPHMVKKTKNKKKIIPIFIPKNIKDRKIK